MTKLCLDCLQEKPLEDYYPSKGGRQGVASYCRLCDNARRKARNEADGGEANRARAKQWRSDNAERAKERDAQYFAARRDVYLPRFKARYVAKKPEYQAASKEWREANAAKITESNRLKRQRDGERIRAKRRQHYLDNKAAYIANARNREASKRLAMPAWADRDKIKEFYEEAARRTAETGVAHVVDHVVPLKGKTVCGLHVHYNLQVITEEANLRKGNNF